MKKALIVLALCFAIPTAWGAARQSDQDFMERVSISHEGCSGDEACYRLAARVESEAKQRVSAQYKAEGCTKMAASFGAYRGELQSFSVSEVIIIPGESSSNRSTFMVKGNFTCILFGGPEPGGGRAKAPNEEPTSPRSPAATATAPLDPLCQAACVETGDCKRDGSGEYCLPARNEHCEESRLCRMYGRCTLNYKPYPHCVHSDDGCRNSVVCKEVGMCRHGFFETDKELAKNALPALQEDLKLPGGVMGCFRPRTSEQCAGTSECQNKGFCAADKNGACRALTANDCSALCKLYGHCVPVKGECNATTTAHCKLSQRCAEDGECTLYTRALARRYSTVFDDESRGICIVGTAADCARTADCRKSGLCSMGKDSLECISSVAGCRKSEKCATDGECSVHKDFTNCVAGSAKDCELSANCKKKGYCRFDVEVHNCVNYER